MTPQPAEPPLQCEQVWRRWTWLGTCDARILGLFRIGLGSLILFDLLDRVPDLRVFYTDEGIAPRSQILESWVRLWRFSIFDAAGPPLIVYALFALGVVCVVLFTFGWRTRLFTILSWIFLMSLDERNLVLLDGGDGVMRISLFWMMFADAGAAYSLDVAWRRRDSDGRAPALPLRVLQVQVIFVYAMAAITKTGSMWKDGTALYHALQLTDWARPFGEWLVNYPKILYFLTKSTLWMEAGFAVLVLIPVGVVRAFAILMILGLHAGIFATMRVGLFSTVMPVTMVLFALPRWIDWSEKKLGWYAAPKPYQGRLGSRAWQVVLALQLLAVLWTQGATRLRILPEVRAVVQHEVDLMSLWQNWAMFAPNPLGEDGRWEGPGKLTNGTQIDVLAAVAPEMLPDRGFYFRRWVKYRSELYANTYNGALRMFAMYVCREFNRDAPPSARLAEYDLVYWQIPTHAPGQPPNPARRLERWHHKCLPDGWKGTTPGLRPVMRNMSPSPSPRPLIIPHPRPR